MSSNPGTPNNANVPSAHDALNTGLDWLFAQLRRGEHWLIDSKRAVYGASVARIIYGFVVTVFVVANFGNREYLWGGASGWADPLRETSSWGFPFTIFGAVAPGHGASDWLFTALFIALGVLGFLFMVGWRTRIVGIGMLWLYVSLVTTNPVATDQTDNALRIILIYFLFTDMSQHCSLDARRRAKRAASARPQRRKLLPEWVPTILHNGGIIAVALQIFIIYVVAGLSKVQGSLWRDGTAVYYPLRLDSLSPWPGLNDLLVSDAVIVNVITYFSVFIQLFFPFLLLARWTRIIALLGIVGMHVGIGIVMGLPLFSLAMMAADGIFIRDATYASIGRFLTRVRRPWRRGRVATRQNPADAADAASGGKVVDARSAPAAQPVRNH